LLYYQVLVDIEKKCEGNFEFSPRQSKVDKKFEARENGDWRKLEEFFKIVQIRKLVKLVNTSF